jgi:DNA-binding CsgD family transcriptional regulator
LSLGQVVDLGQTEAGMFAEILDGLGAAVFLIGPSGNIVHGNLAGRAILDRGDFLHSVRGRLVVRAAAADRSLRAALAGANAGREAIGATSVAIPLISQDDERYVAHLLPLGDARHRAGIGNGAVAALFVQRATMAPPSSPEVIARYYGLTPTELRVLLAIVEVGGGPEVAERLGVADSTVKTHLHRLYQKTGTHGQVGLVKLVAGFSDPLRA